MKKLGLGLFTLSTMTAALAADIDITIAGSGTVNAKEAEITCQENCSIANELAVNTLIPTSTSNSEFEGWSGQRCDAGNGMLFNTEFNTFSGVTNGAKTLAKADIDSDGHHDLAYISLFDGQIGTLTNNGNGSFDKTILDTNLNYPAALAFYDWNNNGHQDLLVTEYGANVIKLYSNSGSGQFTFTKDIVVSGTRAYGLAVADINQDNSPDLAISSFTANTGGNLADLVSSIRNEKTGWFVNNGQDEFSASVEVSSLAAITLDAYVDEATNSVELATAEITTGDVSLYALSRESMEVTKTAVASGSNAYGVALSDIDDNGTIDVLSSHYRPSVLKLATRTESGFGEAEVFSGFGDGVTATAMLDMNNDGYQDIATGIFNTNVFTFATSKGYNECIITGDAKTSVTANFTSSQTSGGNTSGQSASSSSSGGGSGGGSMPFALLAALSLVMLVRKLK
ncbi:FG-GAP repeat domain-containing protein [Thalassotalea euphylliae]|uniref:FG-GAP repeat domain-containing protein n=1 Tax=Thalassotalea euphylliae TaxID=1655234 RepID=UPI0036368EB2